MTLSGLLQVAAVVVFALAAILLGIDTVNAREGLALTAAGLACLAAAGLWTAKL